MGGSRKAFSLILFLVICPLPGHPRPVPNIATPIVVSLTPLGAAALSTAVIGKGILKVSLLKAGAAAVAGGLIGGVTTVINSSNNNDQKEVEDQNSRHQHRYYRGRQNRYYG